MLKESTVPLFDVVMCLSEAADLIAPVIPHHQNQVAYIAFRICEEMGSKELDPDEVALAGAVHDIGAISVKDRKSALDFEFEFHMQEAQEHAFLGYALLKLVEPLSDVAETVKFHHILWNDGAGREFKGEPVPPSSHIIHLADRVAVVVKKDRSVLGQVPEIRKRVAEHSGKMFPPEAVEAFMICSEREAFWLDAFSVSPKDILTTSVGSGSLKLDDAGLLTLARTFSHIIDFRSPFTATHSAGVAIAAETLARLIGFSRRECVMMRVAGYLHDLGKLCVPLEILEKPSSLTPAEFSIIRQHTYWTYRTLDQVSGFEVINTWASFHHERPDGRGYPFRLAGEGLSLGSRIMAVADALTAITEDRPYRTGMPIETAVGLLEQMSNHGQLDPGIVSLAKGHAEEIVSLRLAEQVRATEVYERFRKGWLNSQ